MGYRIVATDYHYLWRYYIMDIPNIVWLGFPAILIIGAEVEVAKGVGFPSKWASVLAIILGIVQGVMAVAFQSSPYFEAAVSGLVAALIASGVWTLVKNGGLNPPSK